MQDSSIEEWIGHFQIQADQSDKGLAKAILYVLNGYGTEYALYYDVDAEDLLEGMAALAEYKKRREEESLATGTGYPAK